ncbi:M23 family metallopeptidase [Luteococcus sediminum]
MDLPVEVGMPVRSPGDGTVIFAGPVAGREVMTIDLGGGFHTTLEPVRTAVQVGQLVTTGMVVGTVTVGTHCVSACLHWGLKHQQTYLDPTRPTDDAVVRLLPRGFRPPRPPAPRGGGLPDLLLGALPASSSGLVRPSSGPVTSAFGQRFHPVLHVWKLHDGMDFGAACGSPVLASAAGKVVLAERNIAYGNRVVVEHGTIQGRRIRTSYNHLQSLDVAPGQTLQQRQQLGRVGTTGYSTGCHLHFMVWQDGALVNPAGAL